MIELCIVPQVFLSTVRWLVNVDLKQPQDPTLWFCHRMHRSQCALRQSECNERAPRDLRVHVNMHHTQCPIGYRQFEVKNNKQIRIITRSHWLIVNSLTESSCPSCRWPQVDHDTVSKQCHACVRSTCEQIRNSKYSTL